MDQYRLLAGISSGRIDHDDYGSFEIEDGEVVVEDYDTARSLVRRYPLLGWDGDDPGRPDEDGDAEAEAESESEEQELEAEAEAESESEPADESDEDADAENEDESEDESSEAEAEVEVEVDDEDREIFTCAGMDGDCTRRVDEPGGLCWQHEDQG